MKSSLIERQNPKEYMRRYLKVAPLALAIFRSIEAKNISSVKIEKPILDVGCGFGEFAGVFFDRKVEMGLDISWKELVTAQKSHKYKKLTWVDAREMPFADNHFGTVLSVSVLEHIKNVEPVIKEIYRVLKKGNLFVFTTNTNKINNYLFWPEKFTTWGYPKLAKKYIKIYHKVFKHETLWTKDKWQKVLERNGFEIVEIREIISPEATKMFDFFIMTSWPFQIIKIITGKRMSWRPKWFREMLVKRFAYLVEQEETEGSNLFVVARKKGLGTRQ
ncbi:class I SAM-dependent methyltransferase [Candidatus Woesebacteria bacterium]|nr:MAG: class I SAM-dependent methyltransferase [Candidatus Woesebacteria bacterium]